MKDGGEIRLMLTFWRELEDHVAETVALGWDEAEIWEMYEARTAGVGDVSLRDLFIADVASDQTEMAFHAGLHVRLAYAKVFADPGDAVVGLQATRPSPSWLARIPPEAATALGEALIAGAKRCGQDLRTMPYAAYLRTHHWERTRHDAIERAGGRCQLCNKDKRLQVHHRTYERRGCEEPGDLTVLCSHCHAKFHDKLKVAA